MYFFFQFKKIYSKKYSDSEEIVTLVFSLLGNVPV